MIYIFLISFRILLGSNQIILALITNTIISAQPHARNPPPATKVKPDDLILPSKHITGRLGYFGNSKKKQVCLANFSKANSTAIRNVWENGEENEEKRGISTFFRSFSGHARLAQIFGRDASGGNKI